MKIKIFILLFIIITGALTGSVYYNISHNKDNQINNDFSQYIDYPLIEYYFLDDNSWNLVIQDLYDDKGFSYIDDPNILESLKTNLVINTFPVGKGSTADGYIFLYKNKQIIKTIPYFTIKCASDEFNINNLDNYSREDIQEILKIHIDKKMY